MKECGKNVYTILLTYSKILLELVCSTKKLTCREPQGGVQSEFCGVALIGLPPCAYDVTGRLNNCQPLQMQKGAECMVRKILIDAGLNGRTACSGRTESGESSPAWKIGEALSDALEQMGYEVLFSGNVPELCEREDGVGQPSSVSPFCGSFKLTHVYSPTTLST